MPAEPPARAEAGGARGVVALAPAGGGAGRIWLFDPRAARRCRDARGDGATGTLMFSGYVWSEHTFRAHVPLRNEHTYHSHSGEHVHHSAS